MGRPLANRDDRVSLQQGSLWRHHGRHYRALFVHGHGRRRGKNAGNTVRIYERVPMIFLAIARDLTVRIVEVLKEQIRTGGRKRQTKLDLVT